MQNLKNIRLIVFDMAGTTVTDQKEVEGCFEQAALKTGLEITSEEITAVQGWSKEFVFRSFWARQLPDSPLGAMKKAENSYSAFRDILENHYLNVNQVTPTEGCLEFLTYLKEKNIKVALTTGFYRKVCDIILERIGWKSGLGIQNLGNPDSLISFSVCSDEVCSGRPAPDMIFKAMQMLDITDPKDVINIGDTPSDLQSGINAGVLRSVGLSNGTHTMAQLDCLANDGIYTSLRHFHEEIKNALSE